MTILLALVWGPVSGCAKRCEVDSDCVESLRCGPGGYCLSRCFAGEQDDCVKGHFCDVSGTKCVPSEKQSVETTPEVTSEVTSDAGAVE